MATTAPALERHHLLRLRGDFPRYAQTNLLIRDKEARLVPLELNTAQRYLHAKVEAQRERTGRIRAIVLKARQEGVSTYVGARIYHGCTLWPRRSGIVLADELKRAGEIFEIYERYEANATLQLPKRTTRKARELSWRTDSKITVDTAQDPDSGRSGTRQYVHASEFALWPYPEETLAGLLESVPATGGEVWIESTAQGIGNAFHARWEQATAGESEWIAVFLPWWLDEGYRLPVSDDQREHMERTLDAFERKALADGIEWEAPSEYLPERLESGARWNPETEGWVLTLEQLAWRRFKIGEGGETKFAQENPATADEAFLVSGRPFFDQQALRHQIAEARPAISRGSLRLAITEVAPHRRRVDRVAWARSDRGWVRIYEMPQVELHYVIGADTATGGTVGEATLSDPEGERGGQDFNSADVIRLGYHTGEGEQRVWHRPRIVAQIHGRDLSPEVFAEQLYGLGTMYSCPRDDDQRDLRERALLGVERNHESGVTTLRVLRELGYDRLFASRPMAGRRERPTDRLGFLTTGDTRRPMLDALAEAVRKGEIELPAETAREMRAFVFNENGRPEAQEGAHDDRVLSAGIALEMTRYHDHRTPDPEEFPENLDDLY